MTNRINPGIVALLVIVALIAGAVIGFFVLRDDSPTSTTEDRIDYGCEVALGMDDVTLDGPDSEQNRKVANDLLLISSLFGGATVLLEGQSSQAEEQGYLRMQATAMRDNQLAEEALNDIVDYCNAR